MQHIEIMTAGDTNVNGFFHLGLTFHTFMLFTKILVKVTKSESLEVSWSQDFFLKVNLWTESLFLLYTYAEKLEINIWS